MSVRRPDRLRDPLVLGVALAMLLALWLVAGLFGPGVVPGADAMAHVLRLRFTVEELLPAARLDGWDPQFGLGYRVFLFYGPGYYWAGAALQALSFGALDAIGAVKALAVVSVVGLPAAVAFLARSFGLDRLASGLAALLALCVAACCGGVGMPGAFDIGLLPQALAAIPVLVCLGAAMRAAAEPRRAWILLTAVSLAAVLVVHPISAIVLAAAWALVLPTLLATDRPAPRAVAGLALAVALAAVLAAFWLVPALAHRDLRGIAMTWPMQTLGERLAALATGRSFLRGPVPVVLAAAGWLFCLSLVRARRRWALALLLAPIGYLLLAEALRLWNPIHLLTIQIAHRGLGYVGVIAMLPAAVLLAHVAGRLGRAGPALALGLAAAAALAAAAPLRPLARSDVPAPAFEELAREIAAHVPEGSRFVTSVPRARHTTGVRWPAGWLGWAAQRPIFDFFNPESTPVAIDLVDAPGTILSRPPDEIADLLSRMGVSHVAVVELATAGGLVASPRFRTVWESPPFALLAVVPRPGWPEPASGIATEAPTAARRTLARPEHWVIAVDASADTTATLALGWSPGWRATLDGRPASLWRSHESLVNVRLPAGASTLELVYARDGWDAAGALVSLAGIAALGVAVFRRSLFGA